MMMKNVVVLCLFLISGCSTKYKLSGKVREQQELQFRSRTAKEQSVAHLTFSQQTDSLNHQHWFKIYPKGDMHLSKGEFKGQVDSLIWYTKENNLQKQIHANLGHSSKKGEVHTEQLVQHQREDQVKEKQKSLFSWWWLWFVVLVALVICLYVKKKL